MSDTENQFLAQFGDELYSPSTKETLSPSDTLSGKLVMLYFSAHWCAPCRSFTPKLISLYNQMKNDPTKADTFELVFVSLDRKEPEYNEYISNMPWKCVPFTAPEELRTKLAMKYKARGIPHLVVVDATEERNVITSEGTTEAQLDPEGKKFPWKPKGFSEVWPEKILTKDGLVDSSTLDKKYLMLYFSAHWCPPCRGFTPTLSQAYKTLKDQRDDFELVFVSSDRDMTSFDEYFGEMPFCALPFEDRDTKTQLSKMFGIQGIPTLLILGKVPEDGGERPLINDNLRGAIEAGDFSDFPFHPKPYGDLSAGADGINENKSLVVFCENEDDDEQAEIVDLVKAVSEKMKDTGIKFFYATKPGGLVQAVRKVLRIEKKMDGVIMALLDIPDRGGFYISDESDLTAEKIEAFISSPGERQQMSQ